MQDGYKFVAEWAEWEDTEVRIEILGDIPTVPVKAHTSTEDGDLVLCITS